jgi:phosphoribosylformylglycinamidine cyclo-ligase
LDYRKAGVDIAAGNLAARRIGELARKTFNERVIRDIGAFGGFYSLADLDMADPVLVTSTDSIGTKVIVARMAEKYRGLGMDIVNHCINDIACCGARPVFFMDYFATSHLKPEILLEIVEGMTDALARYGCALIGGETAEMPDLYPPGEFDMAGFIGGLVDRDKVIDGSGIVPGDKILVLPSNGLHTNGYSLARKVLFREGGFEISAMVEPLESTLAEQLLKPHTCYLDALLAMDGMIKGIAHITGGGLRDNIRRILPEKCRAEVDAALIKIPSIFDIIRRAGSIDYDEMYNVFNMGAGMAVVVDGESAAPAVDRANKAGFEAISAGVIAEGERDVVIKNIPE